MPTVLMTGSSGLIGRHARAALPPDYTVIPVRSADNDLLKPDAFAGLIREVAPDVVLHLAWAASSLPDYRSHPTNDEWRRETVSAARTCEELGARFIATGTALDRGTVDDAYATSKRQTLSALAGAIEQGRATWLRPFYVFDPAEPTPAVLRHAMKARDAGVPVRLATPSAKHDFVHARDVGAAVVAVVSAGLRGVVEIGSGTARRVSELVDAAGVAWEESEELLHVNANGSEAVADVEMLKATGWLPSETERFFADV